MAGQNVVALQIRGSEIVGGWDWDRVRESVSSSRTGATRTDASFESYQPRSATLSRDRDLLGFVAYLLDASSCDQIIAATLDRCFSLAGLTAAGLDFLHPETGAPIQITGKGVTKHFLYSYEQGLRVHDVVLREALSTRSPRQSADVFGDGQRYASAAFQRAFRGERLAHVLYVPLLVEGQVVGTLNLGRPPGRGRFATDEVGLLVDLMGVVIRILVRQLGSPTAVQPALEIPEAPAAPLSGRLSQREYDVAQLVAEGLHDKEIAVELFLSLHTVKQHLKRIYKKAGVRSRVELAARVATSTEAPTMRAGQAGEWRGTDRPGRQRPPGRLAASAIKADRSENQL